MKNIWNIAKKEIKTYFTSPIAYIVLGVFLAIAGYLFFFFSGLFIVGKATMRPFFGLACRPRFGFRGPELWRALQPVRQSGPPLGQ